MEVYIVTYHQLEFTDLVGVYSSVRLASIAAESHINKEKCGDCIIYKATIDSDIIEGISIFSPNSYKVFSKR